MKTTFLHISWPDCPTIEISGDGVLIVDDEEAEAEEFSLALARVAQAWKDSIDPPADWNHVCALHVAGPLPFWYGGKY